MILFANELESGVMLDTDICIVGAGPAGLAVGLTLARRGVDVVILEAGGRRPDHTGQLSYAGEVADPTLHPPADSYRRRGLGGSTTLWGGRCVPLDPIDFMPRPWLGLAAPWPISYNTLLPYLVRAHDWLELGHFDYSARSAIPGGMRPMFAAFHSGAVSQDCIERFSRPTDFGKAHALEVEQSRHVRLILHATCTNIELARDVRSVSGVDCRSRTGAEFRVRARAYVLATGGLEVPRLLLASNTQLAAGIGNQHDLVGRTYMCHLAGTLGRFTPASGTHPWHGYERTTDGIYCRRRLSIAPSVQAGLRIGNAIARLHHPGLADPSHHTGALSALYLARYLLPFEFRLRLASAAGPVPIMPHIANVLCDPAGTLAFAWQILRHRTLADRKYPSVTVAPRAGAYTLDVHAEQLPNPASRVMLSDHRDGYGVPRLRIDWRYLPEDIHTVRAALGLFKAELEAGGHGVLRFDATRIEADILRDGAYGGHHLGTARMSASQRDGVVDAQCSVHGMPNLFVASSAVFPTSGQANPTLTLVALALRLADYLAAFVAPVAQVAESVA